MTQAQWLASTDAARMLKHLRGQASDRKLRSLACAACRQVWDKLPDRRSRRAFELAERFADGKVKALALAGAQDAIETYVEAILEEVLPWDCCSLSAATAAAYCAGPHYGVPPAIQPVLLRDIFGDPFCPSPRLPASVLAWNDGTVRRIAAGIYEQRSLPEGTLDSGRLAVLGDALLDAGCDADELIAHCRSAGPHVRGCWALDTLLGKS
jgi:hypothetical protein